MKMKDYTIIPNELLRNSKISMQARFLLCVLFRHCGVDNKCYPGQKSLANSLGCSDRYIRDLVKKLVLAKLITVRRLGFNKTNEYTVNKEIYWNNSSTPSIKTRNKDTRHLGSGVPFTPWDRVPPNNNQLIIKDNNYYKNLNGLKKCKEELIKNGFNIGTKKKSGGDDY